MSLEGLNGLIQGLEGQASWQTRRQFRQVISYWPKAVGYVVARQTRPTSIQRQVLYVAASTAAWSQTLSFERPRILKKLNGYLQPPLKDIRFSAAQWSNKKPQITPTDSDYFVQHPSYIGTQNNEPTGTTKTVEKITPYEAFKGWSARLQKQQQRQALCPECKCHCPSGELERWSVCSLCAAKHWGSQS